MVRSSDLLQCAACRPLSTVIQTDVQTEQNRGAGAPAGLTPEAIQFAHRMFNAARNGDPVLLQAVGAGLPANLTNDEGKQAALLRVSDNL